MKHHSLYLLFIAVLVFAQKAEASKKEDEAIYPLSIAFLVLCAFLLITGVILAYYVVRRARNTNSDSGKSYRLDHKYNGSYETSMYGNKPNIVVTSSTTRETNANYYEQLNGQGKEVTSSYLNAAYEKTL